MQLVCNKRTTYTLTWILKPQVLDPGRSIVFTQIAFVKETHRASASFTAPEQFNYLDLINQ